MRKQTGTLTLIPLPIDESSQIPVDTKVILEKAHADGDLILVEEAKPCRRKWLHYGLPREAIENFIIYNEHGRDKLAPEMLANLQKGKNIFLMSDCGLPAFCDPGMELVNLCHEAGVKVSSSSFANSVILAVALSGFAHNKFVFEGFLPKKTPERLKELKRILKDRRMSVLMDTPYRLTTLVEELIQVDCHRKVFVALNLNYPNEKLLRGNCLELQKQIGTEKHEFILIIGPENV